KKLPGVQESNVNLATEKLNISFDENAVSAQDIQNAVNKAGYKALTDVEQKSFAITGMTCASCVQTVEKATRKMDGVIESNVNLATEKLNISFDEN
ncbi:copper ion binding protein, partial [Staphylococcus nepalensis]|uniref:copper ion binding protein n=1 Tax=Staphylococcus nepalensis TaxID=214473 RepID=UPI00285E5EA9